MQRLTALILFAILTLISAPAQAAYRDTVLATPGLVSYWQLNEIAGTTAGDSKGANSGAHVTGVSVGMFRLISTGYSAYYNGSGGYTTVNSSGTLNPTSAISLEAWIRPETLAASSSTIIRKDSQYLLRLQSNGALVFRVWIGGIIKEASTPAGTITAKTIYHVVATYNGTSQTIYVNGVAKVTRAQSGIIGTSANQLTLGASSSGGIYDLFTGRIDETAIYNVALASSTVTSHYTSGVDTTPPDTFISTAPPANTTDIFATFRFTSSEPRGTETYKCQFDGGAYGACATPKVYPYVNFGSHTLNVRATDMAGNADPSPATYTWTVTDPCTPAFGTFAAGSWPPGCWRPYANTSPFNQLIPANPLLADHSADIVLTLNSWVYQGQNGPSDMYAGYAETTHDYEHPVYYSQPTDPLYTINCTRWPCPLINGQPLSIRIPSQARAAYGTDGHMTVVDQASKWEYDLYEAPSTLPPGGGNINVSSWGRTRIGTDAKSDGRNEDKEFANATAAHYGLLAGIIRAQEMEAGEIKHALFLTVLCDNGTAVYPATGLGASCEEIGLINTYAPAEGQRFQLNMTDSEIDAMGVPPWKKIILRAIQRYGMYVGDTGGSPWDLMFESGSTYKSFPPYTDPMVDYAINHQGEGGISYWGGAWHFDIRSGLIRSGPDDPGKPWWTRLRVIAPCVAETQTNNCPQ